MYRRPVNRGSRLPRGVDLRDCDIIDEADGTILGDMPNTQTGGRPAGAAGGRGGGPRPGGGGGGRQGAVYAPSQHGGPTGGGQGGPGPWHRAFAAICRFRFPCRGHGDCHADSQCDRGFVRNFLLSNAQRFGYRGPRNAQAVVRFMRPYGEELVEEFRDYCRSVGWDLILRRGGVAAIRDRRTGQLVRDNRRGRGGYGGGGGEGRRDSRAMESRRELGRRSGYGY